MFPLYVENKSRTFPFVTWALIIINGFVFLCEFISGFDEGIFLTFGEIPFLILQGRQLVSLVTSMFLHTDFFHIFGNMIYLLVFGNNVEDRFGHTKYLIFYFLFGILGGLAHSIVAFMFGGSEVFTPAVGASGAIAGILGAYLVFFPRSRIVSIIPFFFIRLLYVPAIIFIGFWFILQLLYSGGNTNVAYIAHIAGFMAGFIIAIIFKLFTLKPKAVIASTIYSKHCVYCGNPLPNSATFCPMCGGRYVS